MMPSFMMPTSSMSGMFGGGGGGGDESPFAHLKKAAAANKPEPTDENKAPDADHGRRRRAPNLR